MQKMPFSRLYPYLQTDRHSTILDESLQFSNEQPIVKPLDIPVTSKQKPSLHSCLETSIDN